MPKTLKQLHEEYAANCRNIAKEYLETYDAIKGSDPERAAFALTRAIDNNRTAEVEEAAAARCN